MSSVLVISLRMHEGRYHGAGAWPPSPARLFQALLAGAGLSGPPPEGQLEVLQWLENRPAPIIAAPLVRDGQLVQNFVPNNDLDAKGGDPRKIGSIRTKKSIFPRIFDPSEPFHYAWFLPEGAAGRDHIETLRRLAERLYQFGRGIDFAWAWIGLLDHAEFNSQLDEYPGTIYRPSGTVDGGLVLPSPTKGSLSSLQARYAANLNRFQIVSSGGPFSQSFRQQPKPRFKLINYDAPPIRQLFEIHERGSAGALRPFPLHEAYVLVETVRDAVKGRLASAFPSKKAEIDQWLIGRKLDGTIGGSPEERLRMIPLPSIGHYYADRGIRRVLVEVPANSPIRAEDIFWAFSALEVPESNPAVFLSVTSDMSMLRHYGFNRRAQIWRTVTAAALPESAGRRRIDPKRRIEQAKNATERAEEKRNAHAAVLAALRHANTKVPVVEICVQREPFEGKGERAEAFSTGSRFVKERLWHVQITFVKPIEGPIVIGDGRFLGLGIMAPVSATQVVAEME